MAVTCARCGAQNPDGNAFCQSCGTPLTAAAVTAAAAPRPAYAPPPGPPGPPGPPVAYASPPPPPVGYQSPYYSPAPGAMQPPVHRTPWTMIIAAIVALVLVMVGAGTAIALLGNHPSTTNASSFTNQLPTPSPAGTPTPIGSPTPIQSGSTASNDGLTLPLPAGWTVANRDSQSITIVNGDGNGTVTAASGASNPSVTAQGNKAEIDKYFASKYPDTKNCPNTSTTNGTLNGAPGIFWILCFTLTSGNQSFPASAALFAGANSDGSVYYLVMLVTSQDNLDAFIGVTKPILHGIVWKLK